MTRITLSIFEVGICLRRELLFHMKLRNDHAHLIEELHAITNEADPVEKFDRIKSFFERHHPDAPAKQTLLRGQRGKRPKR